MTKNINFSRFALSPYITENSGDLLASIFMPHLPSGVASDSQYVRVEKSDYSHWVIYRHKQIKKSFYCMAIKLKIKNLYKIFGEHPQRAFKYIEQGLSKEQILEKTGLSLGVKTPVWPLKKARYLSSWDYPARVNPQWYAFSIA